jgi:drug/metabolite transporter (DMT)-like permease
MNLDDGQIWFVRRDSGPGVHPVSAQGWIACGMIVMSMVFGIVAAMVIRTSVPEPSWLWLAVFLVICVGDALAFYVIARVKTDTTVTISEYRARHSMRGKG